MSSSDPSTGRDESLLAGGSIAGNGEVPDDLHRELGMALDPVGE